MTAQRIRINAVAATALLTLTFIEPWHVSKKPQAPPLFIFGTWGIYKFEEVGGHAIERTELAEKEIGKKVSLKSDSFVCGNNFLGVPQEPCSRVAYRLEVRRFTEYDGGGKGTLQFYGLEAAKKNETRRVAVVCNERPVCYFELAVRNQLAIYYDGWFFFLEKVH